MRFFFKPQNLLRLLASVVVSVQAATCYSLSDRAATEQVAAQLVASVDAVTPGAEIYLGVHQRIIPHWHTYWLNPGDSGLPTTIEWKLPEGATASDILWPIPSRSTLGDIVNYSYSDEITLPTKITVPTNAQPGSDFTAEATVDWLVCNEECIPQQVKLGLTLPVVAAGSPTGTGSDLIQKALGQQPVASPWPIALKREQKGLKLQIGLTAEQAKQISDIWFYPNEWGRIMQSVKQTYTVDNDGLTLTLINGDAPLQPDQALNGVLVITEQTANGPVATGFNVSATSGAVPGNSQSSTRLQSTANIGFLSALLLALLGGIILNLMPCVFPVLSLKALSLVSHADQSPREVRLQGWVYTLGVLASFAVLATLLTVLKAGGAEIGWGFQFQSPLFVLAVAYLMFVVGLSLSGVFMVGGSIAGVGSSLANRTGYSGSFFTGVLATVVATPCTAPFMAAALGYALTQPTFKLFAVFLALGFGLALPYLLLANWPRLQRWLPRPGLWMERTKQALAFPMYGAAAWLVWVLAQQAGPNAVVIALSSMVALGFAAWLYNTTRNTSVTSERTGTGIAALVVAAVLIGSYLGVDIDTNSEASVANNSDHGSGAKSRVWEPYSAQRFETLLAEGKPVFLNFTASWCISCLVNERVALSSDSVSQAFKNNGITYLKGDWTKRDAEITKILNKFGRSGVPLYVFYPAGANAKPVELPQVLTPDIVLTAISNASPVDVSQK